jgi:hypothetical protein
MPSTGDPKKPIPPSKDPDEISHPVGMGPDGELRVVGRALPNGDVEMFDIEDGADLVK